MPLTKPFPPISLKAASYSTEAISESIESNLVHIEDDVLRSVQDGYTQWSTSNSNTFQPTTQTTPELPPGVYEIDTSASIGLFFEKIPVRTEGLIRFPDTVLDLIMKEIQNFWERESVFQHYGLIYKRGMMLYGPPGTGKTKIIEFVMHDVVQRKGVVIRFDDPELFLIGMRALRKIEPNKPIVVIMEDIDSIIYQNSESEVLNILDGVNEVHKTLFLATTNYPEKLGARIMNRPSRFDKRFEIGMPKKSVRKMYFENLFQKAPEGDNLIKTLDIGKWVQDSRGLSFAHLKELFTAVVILGDEYDKAIETLQEMKEEVEIEDDDVAPMGFTTNHKEFEDD